MNIESLLGHENISVQVSVADLKEFALTIMNEVRRDEAARHTAEKTDEKLTPKEVCRRYDLSVSTLWRWAKCGYLKPTKFGRKSYYLKSDIEKLMSGKKMKEFNN